jgi:hypothetical protein
MTTPLGSPDVMFAFDSFASGALDVEELAERLYEICSEETSAIGDGLALLDHYHRLGTLTSDEVERITADLERAAREAPATGPGELSTYVSQRLGFEADSPAASGPARAGHTVSMPTELREAAADLTRSFDLTRSMDSSIAARSPDHTAAISWPGSSASRPRSEPSMPSLEPLRPEPSVPPLRQSEAPEHVEQPAAAAPRPIGPGTVLRSRYVLEREIGSGGMGTVYRALDRNRLGLPEEIRCIAVKVLHPELAARPDALQTLRQEFYQAQSLSHPGIVNVFDFDQDAHVHFMTMELLDGELLGDLLVRIQPNRLRRDVALRLLRDLGVAVAYAHEHGVLHRDLKPGNVMVSRQGEIRVLDFGLGRFQLNEPWISESGMSFDAITPTYASTERLSGKYPDSRDDLFSFACVAYEVLAGRHPFARKSATDAREEGLKPRRIKGLTGRQWRTLKQGLAWSRDDRPGTMHEMLDGLGLREQIDAGRHSTGPLRGAETLQRQSRPWGHLQRSVLQAGRCTSSVTGSPRCCRSRRPRRPCPRHIGAIDAARRNDRGRLPRRCDERPSEGAPAVASIYRRQARLPQAPLSQARRRRTSPTDTSPAATAGAGTAAAAVTGAGTAPGRRCWRCSSSRLERR